MSIEAIREGLAQIACFQQSPRGPAPSRRPGSADPRPRRGFTAMAVKDKLKTDLFPTIWCPGCGIGLIMQQLATVLDELGLDKLNTVFVTGIGCTGRMGAYLNFESVYTAPRSNAAGCRGNQDGAAGAARHRRLRRRRPRLHRRQPPAPLDPP